MFVTALVLFSDSNFTYCLRQAEELYGELIETTRSSYSAEMVKDGVFGARMNVSLENDGPVTIVVDSETNNGSSSPADPPAS